MFQQSGDWERAYRRTRRSLATREQRVRLFELEAEQSILDYGCGDGLDLGVFRRLGYHQVYGFDRSPGLLGGARGSKVVLADAYSLPFGSRALDVVFINGVFHHLEDVERALSEVGRVLVRGGTLCVIEPASSPLRWLANALTLSPLAWFSEFLTARKKALEEELPLQRRWLSMEKGFPSLLEGLGFQIVFRKRTAFSVFIKARASQA